MFVYILVRLKIFHLNIDFWLLDMYYLCYVYYSI